MSVGHVAGSACFAWLGTSGVCSASMALDVAAQCGTEQGPPQRLESDSSKGEALPFVYL